jgi:hypothetical protein
MRFFAALRMTTGGYTLQGTAGGAEPRPYGVDWGVQRTYGDECRGDPCGRPHFTYNFQHIGLR